MPAAVITEEMIKFGKDVTLFLDNTKVKPTSSFWFYFDDSTGWKLVIATLLARVNAIEDRDPALELIKNSLEKSKLLDGKYKIQDLAVTAPKNRLIELLALVVQTGPKDISDIDFRNNSVNGRLIEAAYIYRIFLN